jgi:hypothetical protein
VSYGAIFRPYIVGLSTRKAAIFLKSFAMHVEDNLIGLIVMR